MTYFAEWIQLVLLCCTLLTMVPIQFLNITSTSEKPYSCTWQYRALHALSHSLSSCWKLFPSINKHNKTVLTEVEKLAFLPYTGWCEPFALYYNLWIELNSHLIMITIWSITSVPRDMDSTSVEGGPCWQNCYRLVNVLNILFYHIPKVLCWI